jgi:hypothetical protein
MRRFAVAGGSVLVCLFAVGCGQVTGNQVQPSARQGVATVTPAEQRDSHSNSTGATVLEPGASYPFRLLTHCGIATTQFGARYWQALHPEPEPGRLPGPDGIVTYDGYTSGSMTLVDPELLRFTIQDPGSVADGKTVDFVPLMGSTPALCA